MNTVDSLRAAADNGFAIVSQVGLSGIQVYLVKITNDQVNFDDTASSRVRINTRITVGSTGNNNPHVQYLTKFDTNQVDVLSGASLTDMDVMLGPLAYPYNTGFQAGGTDPSVFQPGPASVNNTQIYVQLTGPGFNQANGNYFKVREVVLSGMDNIFYYVRLTSISDVIPT